ncbi:MAG TPA: OmpA family protein [Bacteroidales bacterium]|nr:OmpA family protein [Bacteroidales bacterium]
MKIILVLNTLILFSIMACVPPSQFKETQLENQDCQEERDLLISDNEKLTVENTELKSNLEKNKEILSRLSSDSLKYQEELNHLKKQHEQLNQQYNDLKKSQEDLLSGSVTETRKLLNQLQATQTDLQKREDELNQLSRSIDEKKRNLDELKAELEKRNQRLTELERILTRKDSAVIALKQKVSEALLGFENQGLTVTQKNGKVYVSLEEKLLFKSGSTEVDAKGVSALKKLARVLEQNPDINIMIEGHTDDVPVIKGSAFVDNWDLSVQRATTIVRILLDGTSINPKRLMASGRGEFMPVDPARTDEARQKNRRTEIILTPKLDELFRILETN